MRSFLLLLIVDIAVVAGGLALTQDGRDPAPAVESGDAATTSTARRLSDEARALRKLASDLEGRVPAGATGGQPPPRGAGATAPAPAAFPEADLDRLEAALAAVEDRRVRARQREGTLIGVRHVYPDLTPDQQRDVAEAIGAYRRILEASLLPGGAGALAGHAAGVEEMRRLLVGWCPN